MNGCWLFLVVVVSGSSFSRLPVYVCKKELGFEKVLDGRAHSFKQLYCVYTVHVMFYRLLSQSFTLFASTYSFEVSVHITFTMRKCPGF